MTGAPIPAGTDAVVMIERCELLGTDTVRVNDAGIRPGQNILAQGKEMRCGEVVLQAGTRLRPQEIGTLAAVGRTRVQARPRPQVAVLATGDELVDPATRPGAGQIRNSNAAMLCAQVERAGARASHQGIARDDVALLRDKISTCFDFDVLILSGGVSAGKRDLVPEVLADLGVQVICHKVAMKPGKPMLFGVRPRDGTGPPLLAFGLPGNPVSSLVCFELFVRPALRGLMGLPPGPRLVQAALVRDFPYRTDRPTYHPALLRSTGAAWSVEPVPWFGSADLRGVSPANAFMVIEAGEQLHRAGQTLPVLCVDED
jgi:molybdopterin molybdotransferase